MAEHLRGQRLVLDGCFVCAPSWPTRQPTSLELEPTPQARRTRLVRYSALVSPVINARFRLGLAAKAMLLLSLGAVFGVVAAGAMVKAEWPPALRVVVAIVFALVGLFPASQARVALLDAILGETVVVDGAVALHSRKSGLSFSLPNGRFGEFLLWNSWEPLVPGATYSLVLARRSRVIVERPRKG